jgi:hypothetical protein
MVMCGVTAAVALSRESDTSGARDEAEFLAHVKEFFGTSPEPTGAPNAVFIAEGDHACQWLKAQPIVTDAAPEQTSYALFRRFLREEPPVEEWLFAVGAGGVRGSVVYDAWSLLCPDVRDSHVWTPPPDYD